ncbi:hypothetical protein GCM10010329_85940 [Streptomyces spiroverticillatus]|uniref:Secreted protein n=1 Tax=Streptomyces finlayi TaxID=67296 RepID=A0A918X9I9_9ACTN|nr:hypothetical protein [Streptomyces finlayi]GHA50751.1 hypothetical protein GCM10010329_85940 [Streptomyces spiroverticillatus]GHD19924.1 hypothetical protein GCM10010334_83950 [Streptomyces finlayi]
MISFARKVLFAGLVSCAIGGIGLTSLAAAQEAPNPAPKVRKVPVSAAEAPMPPAIEDFSYPNAAQVLADRGITLKKGDGHLVLADCAAAHDIRVEAGKDIADGKFCFKASSASGYLTMELPDVFAIFTKDQHSVRAKVTAEGETTTVNVPKNDWEQVGEGDSSTGNKPSVLVELRITS